MRWNPCQADAGGIAGFAAGVAALSASVFTVSALLPDELIEPKWYAACLVAMAGGTVLAALRLARPGSMGFAALWRGFGAACVVVCTAQAALFLLQEAGMVRAYGRFTAGSFVPLHRAARGLAPVAPWQALAARCVGGLQGRERCGHRGERFAHRAAVRGVVPLHGVALWQAVEGVVLRGRCGIGPRAGLVCEDRLKPRPVVHSHAHSGTDRPQAAARAWPWWLRGSLHERTGRLARSP